MRTGLEDRKFAPLDAVLHRIGEAGRGHVIVAAEGDLGRRLDLRERGQAVVVDHRARLAHERIERLLRPAAHECRKLIDIVRLGRIEFGREAPGKDALDDHLGDAVQPLGDGAASPRPRP